ncbi:SAM-dependent methyltransferase [Actinomadura harenae]|uniref:SAM-dependent methyltransferase n=1 Tax=Actinomadura harenae TaxID=2483351 RepID=A0A3M2M4C0_9ACTN|nr:SAM-dependent methyltransferase [Actinomadura harenae]RMI43295.1 SAM-dependent methyltransferase [Actinomadura harenae]
MSGDITGTPPGGTPNDATVPYSARIWNHWLGGKENHPVDRRVGDRVAELYPDIVNAARASRHFLRRSIRYLAADAGIRQFLDVGTGLPAVDNTHEIAQRVAPETRVVYVDNDPLVLAHARALLTGSPQGATAYVDADLRDPDRVLDAAARTLDLTRPVALVLNGVMGHIADDDRARAVVGRLLEPLPAGSHLSLSDGTDGAHVAGHAEAMRLYKDSGAVPYHLRTPERVAAFFDGLDLVEPGVVRYHLWRPDPGPFTGPDIDGHCGVARKP